jgi:uncharacterized protein YndB with AHSA1/START domain
MTEVTASIDIDAPPERVWKVVMDPQRLGEWVTIHRRLHSATSNEPRQGDEMVQTLHLRGVNFKVRWELESVDAPNHASWHGRGPARSHAETEYRLTSKGNGTKFDYRNVFHAPLGPLGAVASRAVVGGLPQREADASLRRLKALIENQSS